MEDQRITTLPCPLGKVGNYEGDLAFKLTPELEFYSKVCTTSLVRTFYVPDTNDQLNSLKSLIRKLDPEFVAKVVVYAREQMYLRTIPMVLTVELAKFHSKLKKDKNISHRDDLVRRLAGRVIQRADEITEMLAYYARANKSNWEVLEESGLTKKVGKLSKQLQYGIADAFEKFDEYQFAKYNRTDREFTLTDALFVVHPPRKTKEKRELYQKIIDGTLATPYTWETVITNAGKTGRPMKEAWEELIDSKRLPYMATLRNLRNMLKYEVSTAHIEKVCNYLRNPVAVKKSRQLPFRYLSAYRILVGQPARRYGWGRGQWEDREPVVNYKNDHVRMIAEALEDAVLASVENIPVYAHETVLLATDVSSSMQKPLKIIGESEDQRKRRLKSPEGSIIEQYDIGAVLAMMLASKCEKAVVGMFGDEWKPINFPTRNILANANEIHKREGEVGYSTNGYRVLEWAIRNQEKVRFDRIFIFTDCQLWDSTGRYQGGGRYNKLWKQYKQIHPEAKMGIFNLDPAGGDAVPVDAAAGDAYLISGWSDKIFEVLKSLEEGHEALKVINDIEL
jgi:60 kDa SS-A/Ro ribonucleoprotein